MIMIRRKRLEEEGWWGSTKCLERKITFALCSGDAKKRTSLMVAGKQKMPTQTTIVPSTCTAKQLHKMVHGALVDIICGDKRTFAFKEMICSDYGH